MKHVYPLKCQIAAAAGGPTRVDVYDDIGEGGFFSEGLSAKSFAAQLRGVKGPLEVHINSGGGDVFDGIAIGNAIRKHKGMVTTVNDGVAASIASVILQAGQDRVVEPGSMVMVHDAFGLCVGNAAEMAKMTEVLDKNSDNIATIYAERAGGTPAQWRATMKDETWYTADEAVEAGLADRVGEGAAALPDGLDLAAFTAIPGRIAAGLRTLPAAVAGARHEPMSGTHSHPHPAYGSQGGDTMHSHEHSHDGDAAHQHSHAESAADRSARLANAAVDPDGDGDDDSTPEGDTDHDYWDEDGNQIQDLPGRPMPKKNALAEQIRAVVREELHIANAAVDESPWDGPAAMSAALKAGPPALAAICAGRRDGDPATEAAYALPHHKHAGDPPNRHGVTAALGRISQTQGLTNKAAADAHLNAHRNAMGGSSSADDHSGIEWLHDLMEGEQ